MAAAAGRGEPARRCSISPLPPPYSCGPGRPAGCRARRSASNTHPFLLPSRPQAGREGAAVWGCRRAGPAGAAQQVQLRRHGGLRRGCQPRPARGGRGAGALPGDPRLHAAAARHRASAKLGPGWVACQPACPWCSRGAGHMPDVKSMASWQPCNLQAACPLLPASSCRPKRCAAWCAPAARASRQRPLPACSSGWGTPPAAAAAAAAGRRLPGW